MTEQEKTTTEPAYLRPADAAKYVGVSTRTLSDWRKRRLLPFVKVSHKVCLIKKTDLDATLGKLTVKAVDLDENDQAGGQQ